MNEIIPSTKLKVISIHKLGSTSCWRKYFWNYVLNLVPRKINFNFFYGGVLHAGFEALVMKGLKAAYKAITKESIIRWQCSTLTNDDQEELKLQFEIIKAILTEASKQSFIKDMKMLYSERQLKCKIPGTNLIFCGTEDGSGTYKNKPASYEIKTASRIYNAFFTALSFDPQIHGYAWAKKQNKEKLANQCAYCIFRKSAKRIKRGQTADGFVREIKQDLKDRPDWYFIIHRQTLGKTTIEKTGKNIISFAQWLQRIYDVPKKELLDPDYWPCNSKECLSFGACPYLMLCKNLPKWKLYKRFYQQREMLYSEEREELKS